MNPNCDSVSDFDLIFVVLAYLFLFLRSICRVIQHVYLDYCNALDIHHVNWVVGYHPIGVILGGWDE